MSLSVNLNTLELIASRGDDHRVRFTIRNSSGVAYDVSANTFTFTVKASFDDALAAALITKTSPVGSGIDLTNAAAGLVDVLLVPADTAALKGRYVYDLQMVEGGLTYTVARGAFRVAKEVTAA